MLTEWPTGWPTEKPRNEKALKNQGFFSIRGGEGGIRTPDRLLTYTRFPGVRLKPLIHLSAEASAHYSQVRQEHKRLTRIFMKMGLKRGYPEIWEKRSTITGRLVGSLLLQGLIQLANAFAVQFPCPF